MKLREIRLSENLSVPKLADKAGLHRRTVQAIEKSGDCLVSTAKKLANALDVTLDELCG